jgi:uncharacterized protein
MKMNAPTSALLEDGRLHLQHGPIDLIVEAFSDHQREIDMAYEQASMRFSGLLSNLVLELKQLRTPLSDHFPRFDDPVAQRMARAVWSYREKFITPMAAVAGAVADEILQALVADRGLTRAYVNNGGDIALHLAPDEKFEIGIAGIEDAAVKGQFIIHAQDNVRGIATSGWRGRSFSLGIADSVTVLARSAAEADAAATMIANAVNVDHPGIERIPACDIQTESDLGSMPVTRAVPSLDRESIERALDTGALVAKKYLKSRLIERVALRLQGQVRSFGNYSASAPSNNSHSECNEESSFVRPEKQILRIAQNDSWKNQRVLNYSS